MNLLQLLTVVLTLGLTWLLGVTCQRVAPSVMQRFLQIIKWSTPPTA